MDASLAWLNSYLDRPATEDDVRQHLSAVGFPVESSDEVRLPSGGTDTCLEVEVTSNRSDCLSHLGLAREVAAATGRHLKVPAGDTPAEAGVPVGEVTSVVVEDAVGCPVYTARVISGVRVGPSPAWLRDRIESVGLRSVNNVVDVTNFVLMEVGQPLHAFDLSKLHGRKIVVRRARKDEPFAAIDGTKHKLAESMLVIADADRAVAVAGVMGGSDTEVGAGTTEILLESAAFDPLSIRRTSRALKLMSDSSHRFERGVDPKAVEWASRRAAALIVEVAGGKLSPGVIRVGQPEPAPKRVSMRTARCNAILGADLGGATQAVYLDRLGLSPKVDGDRIDCTIPTHRRDLEREIDLVEEVARLHGMDSIEVRDRIAFTVQPRQPHVAARQLLNRVLTAQGYCETITFSFLAPKQATPFVPTGAEAVVIDDERRKSEPVLRPSILPSLLNTRKLNQDVGNDGVRLYEVASTWAQRDGRIVETVKLALLADAEDAHTAVRSLRGAVEEVAERLGGGEGRKAIGFHATTSDTFSAAANLVLNGEVIGTLGLLSPKVRDLFDVRANLVAAELELAPLLALYPPRRSVGALPRFPAIERDVSVVVSETVPWRSIEDAVAATSPAMLERVEFLTAYRGKPIEKGRKSVSFRMLFRDPVGTLRHEQVDPQVSAVVEALKAKVGGEIRQ